MLALGRKRFLYSCCKPSRDYAQPAPAVPNKSSGRLKYLALLVVGAAGAAIYVVVTGDARREAEPEFGLNYVKDAKRTPHLDIG
jgi:hypothetical protein